MIENDFYTDYELRLKFGIDNNTQLKRRLEAFDIRYINRGNSIIVLKSDAINALSQIACPDPSLIQPKVQEGAHFG